MKSMSFTVCRVTLTVRGSLLLRIVARDHVGHAIHAPPLARETARVVVVHLAVRVTVPWLNDVPAEATAFNASAVLAPPCFSGHADTMLVAIVEDALNVGLRYGVHPYLHLVTLNLNFTKRGFAISPLWTADQTLSV
jgi:hypothetical protein